MRTLFTCILDFLFPPSPEAQKLRTLSPENLVKELSSASPAPFPFITSLFSYKDPLVTELISSIKNKKDRHALECAGFALFKELGKLTDGKILLIPIPISKKRRRERGYNQCELLIEEIIKLDAEKKFEKRFDILLRTKDKGEQKLKDRVQRFENRNVFSVNKVGLGGSVLLIDDVTTTGSTLSEARATLLSAGYGAVTALTLAH